MRVCIHRGAQQIGGTAIELKHGGFRLLLDLGLPLNAGEAIHELLPPIDGVRNPDAALLGVVLSHGHQDHWGLLPVAPKTLAVFTGAATEHMQTAAASAFGRAAPFKAAEHLMHRRPLQIGPFRVTPYLACHSAFDAYSLLVEAGGRRLFYSGDLRGHGRKAAMFEALLRDPPADIHTLMMEGSTLGRLNAEAQFETETDIEARLADHFRATPGLALVFASAQNVDRVVSVFRAAKQTGRRLVIDLYAAEILRSTGAANIPQADWPEVAFFLPWHQAKRIKAEKAFHFLPSQGYRATRIYAEALRAAPQRFAVLANGFFMADRNFLGCLDGARAVWSQWEGYLQPGGFGERKAAQLVELGVPMERIHTSGHASIPDLQRLVEALKPERLVPVHTFQPERFPELFVNVTLRADGEWWEV